MEHKLWLQQRQVNEKLLEERDKYRQEAMQERELSAEIVRERERFYLALEWLKQRYEEEWTNEMGVGEVVSEIIQRFEEE